MICRATRDLVDAYVDGELPPADSARVAEHLAACAACSSAYERTLETVRRLHAQFAQEQAPDVLRGRIRAALRAEPGVATAAERNAPVPRTRGSRPGWWQLAAAALLAAALGGGASYALATRAVPASAGIAPQVLASHVRALMPGHLTDIASTDQHNVKPWFDGRVDVAPDVPRLEASGFPLIGGRVDYVGGRAVPVVVYGRRRHVISYYSWAAAGSGDAALSTETRQGYHLVHWRRGGLEHWLASDLSMEELEQLARLLQQPPPPPARAPTP